MIRFERRGAVAFTCMGVAVMVNLLIIDMRYVLPPLRLDGAERQWVD
jgi:hypothetical protein